ncbi:hypothetical protein ER308_08770 [Egibacter rhizosphaerae]|uniref:Integrase catalytic domain-containing protein n=1 Tax=Egibacter rhizosphaerae TaxID=1670831 RepID=A0A411YEI6_9ACTN|nr:hypothetical protein ER308_08770 [Egibacter rhizosphaerae]
MAIALWIERTYHRRRRQRGLGKLTPIEYETVLGHESGKPIRKVQRPDALVVAPHPRPTLGDRGRPRVPARRGCSARERWVTRPRGWRRRADGGCRRSAGRPARAPRVSRRRSLGPTRARPRKAARQRARAAAPRGLRWHRARR